MLRFTLQHDDPSCWARAGYLEVGGYTVKTPAFMPVGTLASLKALDSSDIRALGIEMMLANAYHLMLQPGAEVVAQLGGLNQFMNSPCAILTDSGGFQIFSLPSHRTISEAGVLFRSHRDGSRHFLSPESLVKLQETLGPQIAMVLDQCPPANAPRTEVAAACARTTRWAHRAFQARERPDLAWFAIVQGGIYLDLRTSHAHLLQALPWSGFAIGGVSVGEEKAAIQTVVAHTAPLLPVFKPRYLMGVGTPQDLVAGVAAGVDLFDCVLPSRNARNGQLFTWQGKMNIKNTCFRLDERPLDPNCACHCCRTTSRAYLRHLWVAKELSYFRLATLHNLYFYLELMRRMRCDLVSGCFKPKHYLAAWPAA